MATVVGGARRRTREGAPRTIGSHTLRTDIQALRAFAVMSVVLYHLWPNRLSGGFVGVDVFFVISGFLITGHLLREVERTGSLRLGKFWAARARRLLPASLLVLFLSAIAIITLVPRSLKEQFLSEVMASAAYVQNWKLAADSIDYLAAENRPSASQHFWSLSVEEQFYVFLPLLVVAAILVARAARVDRARAVFVLLVLVTVASFAYCLYLTETNPGVAYFSTFTRMWEFGLGGLASFAPPVIAGLTRSKALTYTVLTLAGGAAAITSLFVIDGQTAFPGYAAALPVLGTVAVVRWGGATVVSTLGAFAPVALLGRISYALYLWHWPLIVIPPLVTLHPLTTGEKIAILAVSITISWASTRFFEEPVRFRFAPKARPVLVLGAVLVAMVPVMVVAGAGRAVVAEERSDTVARTAEVLQDMPACLGAAAMNPADPDCTNPDLDGILVPNPSEAAADTPRQAGCWSPHGVEKVNVCQLGPTTGYSLHLLAVGDSHNLALSPAYAEIADQLNWRIDVTGHAGCYWSTADLKLNSAEQDASCRDWRTNLSAYLDSHDDFDAILATHATSVSLRRPDGVSRAEAITNGLAEAWKTQTSRGIPVIGIVDNPRAEKTTVQCVERFGATDPDRCALSRKVAMKNFDGNAEAAERVEGSRVVDMTPFYCTDSTCPTVIGNAVVFRDQTHLTKTYAKTIGPFLGREVEQALRELKVL